LDAKKRILTKYNYRVLIDEATQAIDPEILVAILGAIQTVLIGDHK
jgi:superfamily I DNA and/or RNA helicase